jgi:hypothetical protein
MKQITLYLLGLLLSTAAFADPGPVPSPANSTKAGSKSVINAGTIRFQFNQTVTSDDHQDSVLVIFDRYDHTGAGVVYQLFAADAEQGITIPAVPAGKYFVTIECRGLHNDHREMVVNIKSNKSEKVQIKLADSEVFSKDHVKIPVYHPSFSDMAILKSSR